MKAKSLQTKQGVIVKINESLVTLERVVRRAERRVGPLYRLGSDGEYGVYCTRYHRAHIDDRMEAKLRVRVPEMAKVCASRAAKLAQARWRVFDGPGKWGDAIRAGMPRLMARYALDPYAYTAPEVAPRLP